MAEVDIVTKVSVSWTSVGRHACSRNVVPSAKYTFLLLFALAHTCMLVYSKKQWQAWSGIVKFGQSPHDQTSQRDCYM